MTTPDGVSVLDRFGRRPCVLLDVTHPGAPGIDRRAARPRVDVVTLAGDEWRDVYGVDADGIVVVRPDGHIAFRRASCPDPGEVIDAALAGSVAGGPER